MLPKGYEVPETKGNYMKFQTGENRLRIMSDYIVGYEYWKEDEKGRRPVRKHMDERIDPNDLAGVDNPPKHFWACAVLDYADNRIKILEITQKGLMRTLTGLEQDEDWGDPKGNSGYDLVVTKTGEKMETKYELRAKPKKELDPGILKMFEDTILNLNALFEGKDPFEEKVDVDEVAKALGA
jgi:hypothetical protein